MQSQEPLLDNIDLSDEVRNLNLIPTNNLMTTSDYKFTYYYNLLPSAQALLQQANSFLQSGESSAEQANVLFRRAKLKFLEFERIPDGFKPEFYMEVIEVKESLILVLEDLNARYKIIEVPFSYSAVLNIKDLASSSSNKPLQRFESDNSTPSVKQEPLESDSVVSEPRKSKYRSNRTFSRFDRKEYKEERKQNQALTPIDQAKYFIKMLTACDDILAEVQLSKEKAQFHFKKYFGTSVNEYKAVFKLPDRIEERLPLADPNHIYHSFQYPGKFAKSIATVFQLP